MHLPQNIISSPDYSHGPCLCAALEKIIKQNISEISSDLVGDISYIDHRADSANGAEVESVTHEAGSEYSLNYTFQWSVYRGCSDMNGEGTIERYVMFEVLPNGKLDFQILETELRSTENEL